MRLVRARERTQCRQRRRSQWTSGGALRAFGRLWASVHLLFFRPRTAGRGCVCVSGNKGVSCSRSWLFVLFCVHALVSSSRCAALYAVSPPPRMPARFALCSGAMSRAGKAVAPLVRRAQRLAVVPKRYGSGGAVVNPAEADLYAGGMLTGVRSQRGSRDYAQRMGWVAILKMLSCAFGVQG
jgi:hypothetical protein